MVDSPSDPVNCPCGLTHAEIEVLEMIGNKRNWKNALWVTTCFKTLQRYGLVSQDGSLTLRGQIVLNSKLCGDLP